MLGVLSLLILGITPLVTLLKINLIYIY
jgi:hypothetical protein